jgi:putative transposase
VIDACVASLKPLLGTGPACRAAGKSKATHYRRAQPPKPRASRPRPAPANTLSAEEVEAVLAILRSARFRDLAPAQAWATLLDEDCCLCSISTMYRSLRATGEVRERRAQAAHRPRARPELMASAPNQCWSWDITKLRGPNKGVWFDLYVIIDIFSRYVVDWMVAPGESAELAEPFLARAAAGQDVKSGTLNIHGRSGHVDDLQGRGRAARRPRHRPHPLPAAREQRQPLQRVRVQDPEVLPRPASVHCGTATEVRAQRAVTLDAAYAANPARFRHRHPSPPKLPTVAWINKPTIGSDVQNNG